MRKKHIVILLLSLALSACIEDRINIAKFSSNNIELENIISKNIKVSKLKLESLEDINFLEKWVKDSRPTRVEFWCEKDNHLCQVAKFSMMKENIIFHHNDLTGDVKEARADLFYENITAEDCTDNPSFNDKFGCISSSNMVKMLPDRSQIVEPKKLGAYYIK